MEMWFGKIKENELIAEFQNYSKNDEAILEILIFFFQTICKLHVLYIYSGRQQFIKAPTDVASVVIV